MERNDRVLAAATVSHLYATIRSVEDLEARFIDNLVQFWTNKDRLEGKEFNCIGVHGPSAAVALVKQAAKTAKSSS